MIKKKKKKPKKREKLKQLPIWLNEKNVYKEKYGKKLYPNIGRT